MSKSGPNLPSCRICLKEMQEKISRIECGHTFHTKCINGLLKNKYSSFNCPICKRKLPFSRPKKIYLNFEMKSPSVSQFLDEISENFDMDEKNELIENSSENGNVDNYDFLVDNYPELIIVDLRLKYLELKAQIEFFQEDLDFYDRKKERINKELKEINIKSFKLIKELKDSENKVKNMSKIDEKIEELEKEKDNILEEVKERVKEIRVKQTKEEICSFFDKFWTKRKNYKGLLMGRESERLETERERKRFLDRIWRKFNRRRNLEEQ